MVDAEWRHQPSDLAYDGETESEARVEQGGDIEIEDMNR